MPRFSENAASDTVQIYFMNDVAGNRYQPEFDLKHYRIGEFDIRPSIQINANYDGNWVNRSDSVDVLTGAIEALPALQTRFGPNLPKQLLQQIGAGNINRALADHGDFEYDIDPALSIKHESDSGTISLDASGRFYKYARLSREDRTEWHAALVWVENVAERSDITFSAGNDTRAELPGSAGTAVLDYYGFGTSVHTNPAASVTFDGNFGRVLEQVSVLVSRDYYSTLELRTADALNSTGLAQSDLPSKIYLPQSGRADQTVQLLGNLTYDSAQETQFYTQVSYQHVHQLDPARDLLDNPIDPFDSNTYSFLVGAAESIHRLFVFQVGVGWQYHLYQSSYYQNNSRLLLEGAADWYPTPLISFRAQLGQSYIGSTTYGLGDIAVRSLTMRGDYEFRPNIEMWMLFSLEWDKYPHPAGTLVTEPSSGLLVVSQSANFEIDYRPNRIVEIGLNAGFHDRMSADPVVLGNFWAPRVGLTLTLRH